MTREETTRRTRLALSETLKKMASQKSFSKITVSDLVTACNINRKTFYYHFQDIYALLTWTLEQETYEIIRQFDLMAEYEEALNFFLDYVEENQAFLRSVYHSLGEGELKRFFYNDFVGLMRSVTEESARSQGLTVSDTYLQFISSFFAEAVGGTLCTQMEASTPMTREQLLRCTSILFETSIPCTLKAMAELGY